MARKQTTLVDLANTPDELQEQFLKFLGVSERGEFRISPSTLSMGVPYTMFTILDNYLGLLQSEPYKMGSFIRLFAGYAWEMEYRVNNPEYTYQVPLELNHQGYTLKGSADFLKVSPEGELHIVDTKCVADGVARGIDYSHKETGECGVGYMDQVRWYLMMARRAQGIPANKATGSLMVLNRNYLNYKIYPFCGWTEEQEEKKLALLSNLVNWEKLVQQRDESLLERVASYFTKGDFSQLHKYAQYKPFGACLEWKAGRVTGINSSKYSEYLTNIENYVKG